MARYDYLKKYANDPTWDPSTHSETVEQARSTINAIRNKREVSIPMLESVVSLTYYFESLMELLVDPSLIRRCITRLWQRRKEGIQVFDDEWGYLCFRILVLSINTSIMSKYHHPSVWDTLSSMHGRRNADDLLSESVNVFLHDRMEGPHPDQVIGWDVPDHRAAIVSMNNALILLDLLSNDGKGLLRAWSETRSPTLTGLLFVLWRCAHIIDVPERWVSFIDVARRNYLFASTDTDAGHPIHDFQEDASRRMDLWLSRRIPTAIDLEDARLQISVLTKRMRSEPQLGYNEPPFIITIHYLVAFVLPQVDEKFVPGVEDLFIPLLKEIFNSVWRYLGSGDIGHLLRPSLLRIRLGLLIIVANLIIEHLLEHPTNVVKFRDIVQTMVDLGIVEILAKTMILIGEHYDGTDTTDEVAGEVSKYYQFTNSLRYVSWSEGFDLGAMFKDTTLEWLKTYYYIYTKHVDSTFDVQTRDQEWLNKTMGFWYDDLGPSLGHAQRFAKHLVGAPQCSYARCHDPESAKKAALRDWAMYLPTSHRITCTWSEVD